MRGDEDDEALFDREQVGNYFGFVRGSLRRHRWLASGMFAAIVSLAAGALAALPRTYHVEAKLLAQRSQVLVVRGDGPDAGVAPTRGAVETIRGRAAILSIIAATDLVQHFEDHRSPSQRLTKLVSRLVRRTPETEQDRLDAMVERLEKHLTAWVVDGSVSIAVDWGDPEMARRIVDAAQRGFLAARHAQEVDALAESIAILSSHGASLKADVDAEVAALGRLRAERRAERERAAEGPPGPAPALAPLQQRTAGLLMARQAPRVARATPHASAGEAQSALAAKRRELAELEDARRRRLGEAQARLSEQLRVFTENHPTIVEARQAVAASSVPSVQAHALRVEIAALEAAEERRAAEGRDEETPGAGASPAASRSATSASAAGAPVARQVAVIPQPPSDLLHLDGELREDRDPAMVYARGRLRDAMDKVALHRAQMQATQIDLETAEAAFKYRYSVVTPAQLPKRPTKPNVLLVMVAAVFGAGLASILAAVWADLRSGRAVERWQIERLVDGPILGELVHRLPSSTAK